MAYSSSQYTFSSRGDNDASFQVVLGGLQYIISFVVKRPRHCNQNFEK